SKALTLSSKKSTAGVFMSSSFLRGPIDQPFQPPPSVVTELTGLDVQQRRQHGFDGATEERSEHMLKLGAPGRFGRDGGRVVVARTILFDAQVPLADEDPECGSHAGIRRRIAHVAAHLGGGRVA